jgi:hypothetical protein
MRRTPSAAASLAALALAVAVPLQRTSHADEAPLEPFRGVTTDGVVTPDLYNLGKSGIAQQTMVAAAQDFLKSLSSKQRAQTVFPLSSSIKRRWTNVAAAKRYGISYAEMTATQRQKADVLLQSFLSAEGYRQSKDIMLINGYLAEATGNHARYGAEQFWISIYGNPAIGQPWGWRLEGHHLVLSVNSIGDQVVMTPTFMGAEPTRIPSGPNKGVAVMQTQEATARRLILSLNKTQQQSAQLSSQKGGSNMLSEAYKDNVIIPQQGLRTQDMTEHQRALLMQVIASFADQYKEELSAARLKDIRTHLNNTTFLWIGSDGQEAPIYYRIQSPVLLIEFDQQRAVSLPGDPNQPLRSHVHSMVRTPNGNDYGENLLQQHLQQDHKH